MTLKPDLTSRIPHSLVRPLRSPVARYGAAIVMVCAAILIRARFTGFTNPAPLFFPLLAFIAAGALGGFGPGILASLLGISAQAYFFGPVAPLSLANFLILAVVINGLMWSLRRSNRLTDEALARLAESQGSLEQRVISRTEELDQANTDLRQLADIVNSSEDAIISKSIDGIILSWNPGAERIYGYKAKEIVGKPIRTLEVPGRESEMDKVLSEIKTGRPYYRKDTQRRRKDGRVIDVALTVSPIKNLEGRVVGVSTVARDITGIKEIERARSKGEQALRDAQRIARLGSWEWNLETNRFHWSDEMYRIYGLLPGKDELSYEKISELTHPSDRQRIIDTNREAIASGKPIEYDVRIIRPDGIYSILHAEGRVEMTQGKATRITGTVQDVTEQRLSAEIIRHSEERFRALAENAQEAIVSANSKGNVTYFNRAATKLFGYSEPEVYGKSIKLLLPEAFEGMASEDLAGFLRRGDTKLLGEQTEVNGRHKDGSALILDLSLTKWQVGEETFFTGFIRDISHRKQLEEMKADFISMVSHQLKTPLAIIRGYADNILLGVTGPLNERQRQYVEEMRDISNSYYGLIAKLLNASKAERGTIPVDLDDLELKQVVDHLVTNHRNRIERKGLWLEIEGLEEPIVVRADFEKTSEAISNVIDNAVKFTKSGGLSILVGSDGESGWVEVSDTGPGFDEETLKKVFMRDQIFSGAPKAEGGTGLGLYISKEFMTLQGGDVTVESEVGKGTKFTFTLPLAKVGVESGAVGD